MAKKSGWVAFCSVFFSVTEKKKQENFFGNFLLLFVSRLSWLQKKQEKTIGIVLDLSLSSPIKPRKDFRICFCFFFRLPKKTRKVQYMSGCVFFFQSRKTTRKPSVNCQENFLVILLSISTIFLENSGKKCSCFFFPLRGKKNKIFSENLAGWLG